MLCFKYALPSYSQNTVYIQCMCMIYSECVCGFRNYLKHLKEIRLVVVS